VIRKL